MNYQQSNTLLAGPGIMLISAAIFGFFGFTTGFPELTTDNPPQIIPMVVVLKWTLRGTAIAFLISAIIAMKQQFIANVLYSVIGLISAVVFVVVAVWDMTSVYMSGVHWFLLLVFAAWNGYGSWTALRELMATRRAAPRDAESFEPPEQYPPQ